MSAEGVITILHNEMHQRIFAESSTNTNGLSVFRLLFQKLGVLSNSMMSEESGGVVDENNTIMTTEGTQTISTTSLSMDEVRREAEFMAQYVVHTFGQENKGTPPNKYCKTISRTVNELSVKHDMVFKGIFNKLDPNDDNVLQMFVIVADELFEEGQVNWGRIVSVYAFAAHLAKHIGNEIDSNSKNQKEDSGLKQSTLVKNKIASFVGQYVANKLGQWIVDHGGWDAFVEYFPDHEEFEAKIWKFGLLTAIGLGAVATVFANR